jgi:hypothetical protein
MPHFSEKKRNLTKVMYNKIVNYTKIYSSCQMQWEYSNTRKIIMILHEGSDIQALNTYRHVQYSYL